jgi:hypothetical protein
MHLGAAVPAGGAPDPQAGDLPRVGGRRRAVALAEPLRLRQDRHGGRAGLRYLPGHRRRTLVLAGTLRASTLASPQGCNMDHGALDRVWAELRQLDSPSRRELLDRLQALEVNAGARFERGASREHAIGALREAAVRLGRSPTAGEYTRLRLGGGESRHWPSQSTIRRVIAMEWSVSLAEAQLPPAPAGVASRPDRRSQALAALRRAGELAGTSPTKAEYERFRGVHARERWPAAETIRRRLSGDWNQCLVAAGLNVLPTKRQRYGRAELISALQSCMRDLDRAPSLASYAVWARDHVAADGSLPTSAAPFVRAFGTWRDAVVASSSDGKAKSSSRSARDHGLLPPVAIPNERCLGFVRAAAASLGHVPNSAEYIRYRRQVRAANARCDSSGMLSYDQLNRRFGGWPAVLQLAGLFQEPRA